MIHYDPRAATRQAPASMIAEGRRLLRVQQVRRAYHLSLVDTVAVVLVSVPLLSLALMAYNLLS